MENSNYEYKSLQYYIDSSLLENSDPKQIKINSNYMLILIGKSTLAIYDFSILSFLNENIELANNDSEDDSDSIDSLSSLNTINDKTINYFDFHSTDGDIFFVCFGQNVIIYKIVQQKIDKLSEIEGHFTEVYFGSFNPFNPNIFLSSSKNGFLKIYDLYGELPMILLNLKEFSKEKMRIKWGKKDIGFKTKNSVIYFEYLNFKKENIKKYLSKDNIIDFYFLNSNNDSLIIIKENSIEIIYNNKLIKDWKLKENEIIISTFYYREKQILIMNFTNIAQILRINNTKNSEFEINDEFKFFISIRKPIYINENYLNKNEICRFYEDLAPFRIYSYSLIDKRLNGENNSSKDDRKKLIVQNIKKIISDIPLLISKNNNEDNSHNTPKTRNYFNIEDIKNELIAVKNRTPLNRKTKVINELYKVDSIIELREKYIYFLKLLVNDNTNKNLLKKYLEFLKENKDKLKSLFGNYFEDYDDELNRYTVVFTVSENKSFFQKEVESQKLKFIEFLEEIIILNKDKDEDIKTFENYLMKYSNDLENVSYFNMPIDLSNEQLFYFRNINLIKYYLKNSYDIIKKAVSSIIAKMNKENKLKSQNFVNQDEKKNEMIKERIKNKLEETNINIKLCKEYIKNSTNLEIINEIIMILIFANDNEAFASCYKYLTSAKKNIEILTNAKDKFIIEFLKFYEKAEIKENLIKQFYKKVLPLQCFRTLYLDLNGKDEYYPFEDPKFTNDFVDNNFSVLDIPIEDSLGMTDKFSMKTYFIPYFSKVKKINGYTFINEGETLRNGCIIKVGNHEIGHDFVNVNFYSENCNISIETPRKESIDFCEGGNYLDFALYGKILEEINLKQALYILNEENYNKNYIDFQFGFNNPSREDLEVKGVFRDICKDINLNEDFQIHSKNVYISLNSSIIRGKKILCRIRNDVFGKMMSDKEYKIMIKENN